MNNFKKTAGWLGLTLAIAMWCGLAVLCLQADPLFSRKSVMTVSAFSLIGTYFFTVVAAIARIVTGLNVTTWLVAIPAICLCYCLGSLIVAPQPQMLEVYLVALGLPVIMVFFAWPGANTRIHQALRQY